MRMQVVDVLSYSLERSSIGIKRECLLAVHVLYICPHRLQWDVCHAVVRDDLRSFEDVKQAVSTVVVAKAPIRHDRRVAYDIRELCGCFSWCGTCYKVQVEDTTIGVVFKVLALVVNVQDNSLAVTVEVIDSVRSVSTSMVVVRLEGAVKIAFRQKRWPDVPEWMRVASSR